MTRTRFLPTAPFPAVLMGVSCALALVLIEGGSAQEAVPVVRDYVVETIIDVPGSAGTQVLGINSLGWLAGRYSTSSASDAPEIAFVWRNGRFEYFSVPGASSTRAESINDRGFVTGSYAPGRYGPRHGFVRTPEGKFLAVSLPPSIHDIVKGITPSGWMVGGYTDASCTWGELAEGCLHGFLSRGDEIYTLDPPGSVVAWANRINPSGEVAGECRMASDPETWYHGFLFRAGAYETVDFPGATYTSLAAINPAGAAVGNARIDTEARDVGFVYDRGRFVEIHLLTAQPFDTFMVLDIDGTGTVVGILWGTDGKTRGFVAEPVK